MTAVPEELQVGEAVAQLEYALDALGQAEPDVAAAYEAACLAMFLLEPGIRVCQEACLK